MITRMLKTPTNQAWHFEKAIPAAADGGGAVASHQSWAKVPEMPSPKIPHQSPALGEGAGDAFAGDGTGLSSGKTVITSFIPSMQWKGKPHMYQCFPESLVSPAQFLRGWKSEVRPRSVPYMPGSLSR
ncbi:hypothetical protein RHMOL_Rhmol07G0117100 [Rhododendron molle]|uniref:Uncharacterized protein n=1 Tax=Rhododendron molle TaxID=49168 RepID=A0ACC0MZT8_RHOML|nr:hypothetical protein RHMOL_Rhmol07G0117100 [Rhododendron molle]